MKLISCCGLLALTLSAWSAGKAETPDFIAGAIKNVGGGYFDTGYKFTMLAYPKTMSIAAELTVTDDTYVGNNAAFFGYWKSNEKGRMFFRLSGWTRQAWFDGGNQSFGSASSGARETMSVNFATAKLFWNATEKELTNPPVEDCTYSLHVFGYNRQGNNYDNTKFKFHSLTVTEQESEGGDAVTAHEFVPCCQKGRPALYDRITGKIIYGSTDAFELYDYDIAVAADNSLLVSAVCGAPRTLTLNAGAEYVFDGVHVLSPITVAALPVSGKIKVSLSTATSKGVYTLMENLPEDFSTDSFEIGTLPVGNRGILVKDGSTLKLQLSATDAILPDLMADSIRNDGVGYFNCGYKYKVSAFPKTARVEVDFFTADQAAGTAPGPTVAGGSRALWGYQFGDDKLFFRFNGSTPQVWSNGGNATGDATAGDMTFVADYLTSEFIWGSKRGSFTAASRDSQYAYLLFARCSSGNVVENSVYDLKAYRIYETSDGETVSRKHDYRPARKADVNGLYDVVSGEFVEPTAATAEFTLTGARSRLAVNGEVAFVAGEQSIASLAAHAVGWELTRDADGEIVSSGEGATAAFTMPATPATLIWKCNLPLTEGDVKAVKETESYVSMSVAGAVTLNFDLMARLVLKSGLMLEPDAAVTVNYSRIHGPGVYTLIANAGTATAVDKFTFVTALPEGLSGTLALAGADLVLLVRGTIAAEADLPECLLASVRNDGVGYVDLGYKYHVSSYPHTARIELDYATSDYAGYGVDGMESVRALFGYQDNYHKLIVRYSGSAGQVWSQSGGSSFSDMSSGDIQVVADYMTGRIAWDSHEVDFAVPDRDGLYSYLLFARCMNADVKEKSLYDLKAFRIYEQTAENGEVVKAYDYRPCLTGGRLALWDSVHKTYKYLDDGHYTAGNSVYPDDVYGTSSVTQEFASAWTVSPRAVAVRPSDLDHRFTFIADGTLVLKESTSVLTVTRYSADGTVLEREDLGPQTAGAVLSVPLKGAVKAVVMSERLPLLLILR